MKPGHLEYIVPNFASASQWVEDHLKKIAKAVGAPPVGNVTMSTKKWLNVAKSGKVVNASDVDGLDVPQVSDLDRAEVQLARSAFHTGRVNMPIVLRVGDNVTVISGAGRIAYLRGKGLDPEVWLIDTVAGQKAYIFDYVFSKVKDLATGAPAQTIARIVDDKIPHFNRTFGDMFPGCALYMATDQKSKQPLIGIRSDTGPIGTYNFTGTYKVIGPLIDIARVRDRYDNEAGAGRLVFKRVRP